MELKNSCPDSLIFVFEGVDDKFVYSAWIRRIKPEMQYEPLPCNSKRNVLRLREVCNADKGDLSVGVFYFIDHDFDGLCGFMAQQNTFMTETYSVETI
jgi:hypothetical protein